MALLGGCAATLPPAQPPTSLVPDISAADLKRAAQVAYDQGFAAGRRYQHKHDQENAGADAGQPDGALPNAQIPAGAAPASCPPQTQAQQPAPVPIPPLPPSSSYTTSGPAQPLSQ